MEIKEIQVKSVLTKSNLPVSDYSVNPYMGCTHACKYCYASFMKRFTNHPEPWGEFLDVKFWPEIRYPERYSGKELFFGSVTDPYLPQEETYTPECFLKHIFENPETRQTLLSKIPQATIYEGEAGSGKKLKDLMALTHLGVGAGTIQEAIRQIGSIQLNLEDQFGCKSLSDV